MLFRIIFFIGILQVRDYVDGFSLDDLDNFINPEDLNLLSDISDTFSTSAPVTSRSTNSSNNENIRMKNLTDSADCFGFGSLTSKLRWFFNLKPMHSDEIQVEFFMTNRRQKTRVQVIPGEQFGLEWTYYNPHNPTIIIVHGFLSYSQASWVINMTNAFLEWDDTNIITVDWSRGGSTWKYWRAVANTRTVGSDLARFLQQVINATGAKTKDFHFVGHSLGAHICSYAAVLLGGVRRITGLDPAQPCFITTDLNMLLDKSDAEFVDVIHTNGREISKLGLGVPNTCGHMDFYPNGGMKQPGCHTGKSMFLNKYIPISPAKLSRAVCNHGRAYLLFTESLKRHNCSLLGHTWDLSYKSVNSSISIPCTNTNCAELGVRADRYEARGSFYVLTTGKIPYCELIPRKVENRSFLLSDIQHRINTTILPLSTTEIPPKAKKGWFNIF